jgi:ABC-2 type transport system ATP-binding protein
MRQHIVLRTTDLTKRYPASRGQAGRLALDHLNLVVQRGEIFGYLGPNGAGKTTTIRLLLDLIRPSSGNVEILGLDAQRDSVTVKRLLGNLPSEVRLWDHMTGLQVLRYLSRLRPGCNFDHAIELAERLNLNLNTRVRSYSTGNKRKLGIVQALMHRPPLLILDEPTMGLDPLVSQTFNQLLLEARDRGQTVFLSSHVLSEVEQVCDRVAVLRDGTLQAVERISDLKNVFYRWLTFHTAAPLDADEWAALPGVNSVERLPNGIRVCLTGSVDPVVKLAARYPIQNLTIEEPSLEDFFMTFYGKKLDD